VKFSLHLSFLSVLIYLITACSNNDLTVVSDYIPETVSHSIPDYHIGVDDVLAVNVWRNADLNVTVPVRPDGKISVPLVGDVLAGGLTSEEVSKNITKKLAKYIRDPQVTVIITDLRSHEFLTRLRVTGAVRNQISIKYRQGMTVLDAVLSAGGVNDFAAGNRTKVYRKENNSTIVIPIYLDDILFDGELETNIMLRAGDIVTVPERLF